MVASDETSPSQALRYRAGFARREITAYEPGMAMLGWEHPHHKVRGVGVPLFARAMYLADANVGSEVVLVVAELGYITCAVRLGVLAELQARAAKAPELAGLGAHNVALGATHTHSGPTGFSRYLLYISGAPGFSSRVHDALAAATQRGLRRLLLLGQGAHRVTVAVVPLAASATRPPARLDVPGVVAVTRPVA